IPEESAPTLVATPHEVQKTALDQMLRSKRQWVNFACDFRPYSRMRRSAGERRSKGQLVAWGVIFDVANPQYSHRANCCRDDQRLEYPSRPGGDRASNHRDLEAT